MCICLQSLSCNNQALVETEQECPMLTDDIPSSDIIELVLPLDDDDLNTGRYRLKGWT